MGGKPQREHGVGDGDGDGSHGRGGRGGNDDSIAGGGSGGGDSDGGDAAESRPASSDGAPRAARYTTSPVAVRRTAAGPVWMRLGTSVLAPSELGLPKRARGYMYYIFAVDCGDCEYTVYEFFFALSYTYMRYDV